MSCERTPGVYWSAGVCALNNILYVVGGSDPCGQKGLKNCDAFDPVNKTWTNCTPLNISTSARLFSCFLLSVDKCMLAVSLQLACR